MATIELIANGLLLTSDSTFTLLMITNYCNKQQIDINIGKLDTVIAICLNSKNEKIIKGAFLLTTNIIEI